jgi:hypothetical protein
MGKDATGAAALSDSRLPLLAHMQVVRLAVA